MFTYLAEKRSNTSHPVYDSLHLITIWGNQGNYTRRNWQHRRRTRKACSHRRHVSMTRDLFFDPTPLQKPHQTNTFSSLPYSGRLAIIASHHLSDCLS